MQGKVVIISAPSGAGKTTLVRYLLAQEDLKLGFSISACTRPVRTGEAEGRDYYFLTIKAFTDKIEQDAFVEWEEVYKNQYYGTLKSEINRIWSSGRHVLFDVDVMGGTNLKQKFGDHALSVFIKPPSLVELQKRLESRGSETADKIASRVSKARQELKYEKKFDLVIVNDDLETAQNELTRHVKRFLEKKADQ